MKPDGTLAHFWEPDRTPALLRLLPPSTAVPRKRKLKKDAAQGQGGLGVRLWVGRGALHSQENRSSLAMLAIQETYSVV